MPKIRIKNTATVPLNGKRPGEVFYIDVDDDGVPLELFWRKRFRDQDVERGYLTLLDPPVKPAAVVPDKSSPASPATSKK